MKLSQALSLNRRAAVAFVGGGGKTTAMFCLARELSADGSKVITTTTTRIFAAQTALAPVHIQSLSQLDAGFALSPHVLLTGEVDQGAGKAFGVSPENLAALIQNDMLRAVLIEADGSRMRPIKAPAGHEPVIPPMATHVVAVIGIDALGKSLDEKFAHRPELIARATAAHQGELMTPALVARLLLSADGGLKGVPPDAQFFVLINKVEQAGELDLARQLAQRLIRQNHPRLRGVVVGAVANNADPVREIWCRVSAVVLAAGEAKRMGTLKQVLPWRDTTLIGQVVKNVLKSEANDVIVVTGAHSQRVVAALAGERVQFTHNANWQRGQSESVRAGLGAISANVGAAIFLLADQPNVSGQVIDALIGRWRETAAPIVAARVNGERANPVLFDRGVWRELQTLVGDTGGRAILDQYGDRIEWVDWDGSILGEADTPDDYDALIKSS